MSTFVEVFSSDPRTTAFRGIAIENVPPGMDLSQIPLAPNPNGDPPNFDGGPDLQSTILATGVVFIVISSAFVIIRLWTSLQKTRKLHLDDCAWKRKHKFRSCVYQFWMS